MLGQFSKVNYPVIVSFRPMLLNTTFTVRVIKQERSHSSRTCHSRDVNEATNPPRVQRDFSGNGGNGDTRLTSDRIVATHARGGSKTQLHPVGGWAGQAFSEVGVSLKKENAMLRSSIVL